MATFYELDSTRANTLEHWWGSRDPLTFVIVMVMKWLRIRSPMASDDASSYSTLPFVVESLPEDISRRFEPLTAELLNCGFSDPVYHYIHGPGSTTHIYWATFRHESGHHAARIHNRYWDLAAKRERALFPLFFTAFSDGTFLLSSSGRRDTAAPPKVVMNRMPGAKTAHLWTAHLRKVEEGSGAKAAQEIRDQADLIQACERLHVIQRDFHLGRRFFRERTVRESSDAEASKKRIDEVRAQGAQYPEVVAEIARLEEQKPRWSQAIWLLVLSLVAFLAIGSAQWQWETTLWLIPILFFHEFGHWVAMKIFGYRNMRMFFIPFFGAAVSGQNRTISGWKKALVSLAGPLPGIFLGAFLCVAAIATGIAWMRRCAVLLVILNLFNLLPLLPLDGGRFFQLTLFCRNRWLDILFRFAAVGGLIGLTAMGFGKVLIYIGISLALGLPLAFKIGEVTDRFKREPLPPPSPGEDHIPLATADQLIAAVKEALPKAGNRIVAQQVLNIYETINARPPSALATIGLLGLYGGAIALSVLCLIALLVASQGSFGNSLNALRSAPRHKVSMETVKVWRGAAAGPSKYFAVTTLKNSADARSEFEQFTRTSQSNATALLFGDSVIVEFPASAESETYLWSGRFSAESTNTFVASNNVVDVTLSFIAPNLSAATNLEEDLNDYLEIHGMSLLPPWDPMAELPGFASNREARKVWNRINRQVARAADEAFRTNLMNVAAGKNESDNGITNRVKDMLKLSLAVQDAERARLAAEYAGTPFLPLVEWNGQLAHLDFTNRVERAAIQLKAGERLGRAESTSGYDSIGADGVTRSGLTLRISHMSLPSPEISLPELINWLSRRGCRSIRYRIDSE
jgi:Zn-dependent protease